MGYYKDLAYDKMVARRDGGSFTRPRQQTQPVPVKVASMAIAAGANGSYHLWTVDDLKKAFNRGYAVTTHDGQQVTNDTLLTLPGSGKAHKVSALLDGSFVNL